MSEGEGGKDWFEAAIEDGPDDGDAEETEPERDRDDAEEADPGTDEGDADEDSSAAGADEPAPAEGDADEAAPEPDADVTGPSGADGADDPATPADDGGGSGDREFGPLDDAADDADADGAFSEGGGDEGGLFEDDFASALDDADGLGDGPDPSDEAFAMGTDADFGGLSESGVEGFDEEVDSELPRIELGIEGLDAMIAGGVPQRTLMVAIGSAGTGKTTLGLQFLNHGLEAGEKAVYITLEETRDRVIRSATEKGFRFDEFARDGDLAVVDIDPVEMANSLQTIRSELPRLIDEFGAERLVLDSVSLLEMMYEDRATRRNEIYDFTKSLKDAGVTTLLTSEASEDSAYASRHGIVEYLTDAVFVLQYVRPSDFRETRLAIEIQKIRDANHSRETKPYEITDEGIEVHRKANIF